MDYNARTARRIEQLMDDKMTIEEIRLSTEMIRAISYSVKGYRLMTKKEMQREIEEGFGRLTGFE